VIARKSITKTCNQTQILSSQYYPACTACLTDLSYFSHLRSLFSGKYAARCFQVLVDAAQLADVCFLQVYCPKGPTPNSGRC